jgi:hypothetical protein
MKIHEVGEFFHPSRFSFVREWAIITKTEILGWGGQRRQIKASILMQAETQANLFLYFCTMISLNSRSNGTLCYALWNHYPQLDLSLKAALEKLIASMGERLANEGDEQSLMNPLLAKAFALRLEGMKWLAKVESIEPLAWIDQTYPHFEEMKQHPRWEILIENILFALRCNRKVVQAMLADAVDESALEAPLEVPNVTYHQFVEVIALGIPDQEMAQNVVDWLNASLKIELVILATALMEQKQIKVLDSNIDKLANLVADAAQDYYALAAELGVLQRRKPNLYLSEPETEVGFVAAQQELAEWGMDDFVDHLEA